MNKQFNESDYFDCPTNGRITLAACVAQRMKMGRKKKHPCRNCDLREHENKTIIPASEVLGEAQKQVDAEPGRKRDLRAMGYQMRYLGGLRNG